MVAWVIGALLLNLSVAGVVADSIQHPQALTTNWSNDTLPDSSSSRARWACKLLSVSLPGLVSFPGEQQYCKDIAHAAVSSQQNATCSVEPQSVIDISLILKLVGDPTIRSPFAVKSGGHGYNLGQSSTPGVQISMARFTDVKYDAKQGTVTVGTGLTWGEVYSQLESQGVVVNGGRINGIGVGGLSLGGGYGWRTNQVGLAMDTIVGYELILPAGIPMNITNATSPDLFFALKGGLNNFGIVTRITYQALPQTTKIYGGLLSYSIDQIDAVNSAIANFSLHNTDPKAELLVSFAFLGMGSLSQFIINIFPFYDAPRPPNGTFDEFLAIPYDPALSAVKSRTFVDFMCIFGSGDLGIGPMGIAQHVVPLTTYTPEILSTIIAEIKLSFSRLTSLPENRNTTIIVSLAPEPFFNAFSHSRGGAYPHPASRQVTPMSSFVAYSADPTIPLDVKIARQASFVSEIKRLTNAVQAKGVELGLSRWDDILYPNYALADTPLALMYGSNVPRLRQIAARYDPGRVMTLTGGPKFL